MKIFLFTLILLPSLLNSQDQVNDTLFFTKQNLDEVVVTALRASVETPVAFKNIESKDISKVNLGQDIPTILKMTPSLYITSDAGNGIGYSGMNIRGSDGTRINVTINGVPLNDSESHMTYWVNLPDFISSTSNIQIQRGVGTSTNGSGAFGASINILTENFNEISKAEVSSSIGSYDTFKNTFKFSTGTINNRFEFNGRISKILSDGYIDRASSKLDGYFFQALYKKKNTNVKLLTFGGHEVTYQAWYGLDRETINQNRRYNYAGLYYDENGIERFYDKQEDNYKQDHFHVVLNQKINNSWKGNLTLHYTHGRGYYEEYYEDQNLSDYNIISSTQVPSDLISRKWLDNNFYGSIFNFINTTNNYKLIFGGSINNYLGDHFGEVIWARDFGNSEIRNKFYDNYGNKNEFNLFVKFNYKMRDNISLFADIQNRSLDYKALLTGGKYINKKLNFINPKMGLYFKLNNQNQFYVSYSRAHREPTRTDYENGNPFPEKLDDFELGWRFSNNSLNLNVNMYYMDYENQLVLTGEKDEVGYSIRSNVGESYRLGLELDAIFNINNKITLKPNFSISSNKNKNYFFEFDNELKNFGNTDISFSPNIIIGNSFEYSFNSGIKAFFNTKYVGKQFMSNTNDASSLLSSFIVNDLGFSHNLFTNNFVKNARIKLLINNLLDRKYESFGGHYFYNIDNKTYSGAYYYPMAGINFLAGIDLIF